MSLPSLSLVFNVLFLQNNSATRHAKHIGWTLTLLGASTAKMSAEKTEFPDLLQHADRLFDEDQFQEAVDILKKHPVS